MGTIRVLAADSKAISGILNDAELADKELDQQLKEFSEKSLYYKVQSETLASEIASIAIQPTIPAIKSKVTTCKKIVQNAVKPFAEKLNELKLLQTKAKALVESLKALKAACPDTKEEKEISMPIDCDFITHIGNRLSETLAAAKAESSKDLSAKVNEVINGLISIAKYNEKSVDLAVSKYSTYISDSNSKIDGELQKLLTAIQVEKAKQAEKAKQTQIPVTASPLQTSSIANTQTRPADLTATETHLKQQSRSVVPVR